MRTPRLPVVDRTDAPADLNGLVRFAERRNLIYARVPSNFNWSVQTIVESSWNVMAHGDARESKWRGNWRMEWVASTLYTTSEHSVSSITTAHAHTSAASSLLNRRPRPFKWTRPFRRKTKSGFCTCVITFQTQSTHLIQGGKTELLRRLCFILTEDTVSSFWSVRVLAASYVGLLFHISAWISVAIFRENNSSRRGRSITSDGSKMDIGGDIRRLTSQFYEIDKNFKIRFK
jgi:hypothetical protein